MNFASLTAMAAHFSRIIDHEQADIQAGLEDAAKLIQKEIKSEIGTYQGAIGPHAAWAELAESTKADRVRKGFAPNNPLKRTGKLRNSIKYTVSSGRADIGSNNKVAVYQEYGTNRIPPRSFIGGGTLRKSDEAVKAMNKRILQRLLNRTII